MNPTTANKELKGSFQICQEINWSSLKYSVHWQVKNRTFGQVWAPLHLVKNNTTFHIMQGNDPKNSSKSISEWPNTKLWTSRVKVGPSVQLRCYEFKWLHHAENPPNVTMLEQYCLEEWAWISLHWCATQWHF